MPYCRAANERIAEVRDQFGDRTRYVFVIGLSSAGGEAETIYVGTT
jgi:hypothetical protein